MYIFHHRVFTFFIFTIFCTTTMAMVGPAKKLKRDQIWLGRTLLTAIYSWDLPSVENFLEEGAPVNYTTASGDTPLMWASATACPKIIEALLKAGADVHHLNENQESALGVAAYWNKSDNAALLIRAGANLFHADKNGQTLLMDVAREVAMDRIDEAYATGAVIVEKMLSIPSAEQKMRLYIALYCFKRLHPIQYPNFRNFFKPYLQSMIKDENRSRVRMEIENIDDQEVKQHLLNKYFREGVQ